MKTFTALIASASVSHGIAVEESPYWVALPDLGADPGSITVSGYNAGATQACMLQVILSGSIKGASCIKGAAWATRL